MNNFKAPANTALIIVDMQNDFCPGGALAVEDGDKIIPVINAIKKSFDLCIYTQDWHPKEHKSFASNYKGAKSFDTIILPYGKQVMWPEHCIQYSEGAKFHKDLNIDGNDLILQKGTNPQVDSYSGFYENDKKTKPLFPDGKTLIDTLKERGIIRVVICGLAYDFCVGWHALDARKEGLQAIIAKDATRSIAMPLQDEETNKQNEKVTSETEMDKQLSQAGIHVISISALQDLQP